MERKDKREKKTWRRKIVKTYKRKEREERHKHGRKRDKRMMRAREITE